MAHALVYILSPIQYCCIYIYIYVHELCHIACMHAGRQAGTYMYIEMHAYILIVVNVQDIYIYIYA